MQEKNHMHRVEDMIYIYFRNKYNKNLLYLHDADPNMSDCIYTGCGKITSLFEMSALKLMGVPGGCAWSRSRDGILKFCKLVFQSSSCVGVTSSVRLPYRLIFPTDPWFVPCAPSEIAHHMLPAQ